ncbi:MAG: hypothetical protein ACK4OJ_00495 [Brevundimonas sp.]|jgi:hypothetical protein
MRETLIGGLLCAISDERAGRAVQTARELLTLEYARRSAEAAEAATAAAELQIWIAVATLFGLGTTVALAYLSLGHSRAAANAAQSAVDKAQRQVDAALDALAVSRDAVETSERQGQTSLRAYLIPEIGCLDTLKVGEAPRIRLRIRNAGQTPARDVQVSIQTRFFAVTEPELPPFRTIDLTGDSVLLGTHEPQTYIIPASFTLTRAQLRQLTAKTHCILAQTIVSYEDVFLERHETRFTQHFFGLGEQGSFTPAAGANHFD